MNSKNVHDSQRLPLEQFRRLRPGVFHARDANFDSTVESDLEVATREAGSTAGYGGRQLSVLCAAISTRGCVSGVRDDSATT